MPCHASQDRAVDIMVRSNELDFVEYRFSDHETKEKSSGCRVEV